VVRHHCRQQRSRLLQRVNANTTSTTASSIVYLLLLLRPN
jgi:hypothetical protein